MDIASPLLKEQEKTAHRIAIYMVVGCGLVLTYYLNRGSHWVGDATLHTVMEAMATLLAAIVGVMALARYYSKKNIIFLMIGVGFLGTSFLDGYHSIVTSAYFKPLMLSDLPSLIPWSWVASRLFLSIFMLLAWVVQYGRKSDAAEIKELYVYVGTGLFTVGSFLFFIFVPLPRAYYPEFIFHRPEEFIPALFFGAALVGYLYSGGWKKDDFEHWLVLSLIVGLLGQSVFMSYSEMLFDMEFDSAHLLKKISYVLVMVGLLISMYKTFRKEGEKTEYIREILKNTAYGIIVIDMEGRIETFNDGAEKIFGHKKGNVIGKNVNVLIPKNDRTDHDKYIAEADMIASRIINKNRSLKGIRDDGTIFPVELTISQMKFSGHKKFIGIIRDITKRKEAEEHLASKVRELEETNKDLEEFNYIASHDLQEPLRTLSNYSELLREDLGDNITPEAIEDINYISQSAERMRALVQDLLQLSRASKGSLELQNIDLGVCIESVVRDLEVIIKEAGASVEWGDMPLVNGDSAQLSRVMQNLISNGIKFHDGGAPHIQISANQRDSRWEIAVSDNGIGIKDEYLEQVFGAFKRLHGQSKFKGTGIGLAVVKKIVERHGGGIWAESAPGVGSTFKFTLGNHN